MARFLSGAIRPIALYTSFCLPATAYIGPTVRNLVPGGKFSLIATVHRPIGGHTPWQVWKGAPAASLRRITAGRSPAISAGTNHDCSEHECDYEVDRSPLDVVELASNL